MYFIELHNKAHRCSPRLNQPPWKPRGTCILSFTVKRASWQGGFRTLSASFFSLFKKMCCSMKVVLQDRIWNLNAAYVTLYQNASSLERVQRWASPSVRRCLPVDFQGLFVPFCWPKYRVTEYKAHLGWIVSLRCLQVLQKMSQLQTELLWWSRRGGRV